MSKIPATIKAAKITGRYVLLAAIIGIIPVVFMFLKQSDKNADIVINNSAKDAEFNIVINNFKEKTSITPGIEKQEIEKQRLLFREELLSTEKTDSSEKQVLEKSNILVLGEAALSGDAYAYDKLLGMAKPTNEFFRMTDAAIKEIKETYQHYTPSFVEVFDTGRFSPREFTYRALCWPDPEIRRVVADRLGMVQNANVIPVLLGHMMTEPNLLVRAACINALNNRLNIKSNILDKNFWVIWIQEHGENFYIDLTPPEMRDALDDINVLRFYAKEHAVVKDDTLFEFLNYLDKLEGMLTTGRVNACYLWGLTGIIVQASQKTKGFGEAQILHPMMKLIDIATDKLPIPGDTYTRKYSHKEDS